MTGPVWRLAAAVMIAGSAPGEACSAEPSVQRLELSAPRAAHAAVRLPDGRVAFIGGCVAHSCEPGPDSGTVEIFDPADNTIRRAGRLALPRVGPFAVALADGRILVAGGWSGGQVTPSIEVFDPATGKGREILRMGIARAPSSVILADGRIAFIGGDDGRGPVSNVEIFDPATMKLAAAAPLPRPRAGGTVVLLADGRVLLAGGGVKGGRRLVPTATADIADPALTHWREVGLLRQARYKHASVALADGRALIIGGSDARDSLGKISAIEVFDPARLRFGKAGAMLRPRFKLGGGVALLGDGRVFIGSGGKQGEIFDPRTGQSTPSAFAPGAALSFSTVTPLGDGRVIVAGGYDENTIAVSRAAWIVRP